MDFNNQYCSELTHREGPSIFYNYKELCSGFADDTQLLINYSV